MAAWRMVGTYFLLGTQAELMVYSPRPRYIKEFSKASRLHTIISDSEQVLKTDYYDPIGLNLLINDFIMVQISRRVCL